MTNSIAGLKVESVSEDPTFLKILIYGVPGAGKTMLAASATEVSDLCPILFVDVEGGTLSVKEKYPDLQRIRVRTLYDAGGRVKKTAWEQLNEDLYEALKLGEGGYATIIVDNMSEAYQLGMADTMAKLLAEHPERDPDIPGLKEYGRTGSQVRRFVRHLRDVDAHVILTAHEMAQTNDSGAARAFTPSFPGKLPYELSGFMDMVLYLYTKQDKDVVYRNLQTQPVGKYLAKDRSGKLPLILRDPTMAKIYELYQGREIAA